MQTATCNPARFRYTFGPHTPALVVAPGKCVRFVCPDSDNILSDGQPLPPDRRGTPAMDGFAGNPMCGPVFVEGAQVNHTLVVQILSITLDRRLGRTLLASGHGLLDAGDVFVGMQPARHMYDWDIDTAAGVARLNNPQGAAPTAVTLKPFIGCAGVCPHEGSISTLYAGDHGGNMDLPFVAPGASLLLPIEHNGALFMLGDIHAAQGHGEIVGGGIETSGEVHCTIGFVPGDGLKFPRAQDAQHAYAIASHASLREAVRMAYARLLSWICVGAQIDRRDAYVRLSQCGSVILGNCVTSPYTVAAAVPIAQFTA